MAKDKIQKQVEIKNRRASFEYSFLDTFTAGLVLTGTEIKSIRQGKANLTDAYCIFFQDELFVRNMHISMYDEGTHFNHDPLRDRKLLLSKRELGKLMKELKNVGLTIIPTRLFISDKGYAKLNIALAKGKKTFDKRDDIKEKDIKRDMDRAMR
ncbi:SsrA-binding protein SmpB [Aquirufa sp.]|jgi:SsrA-binding protein|uniref:SsrA-binding protein SmpB n=1 Tax=Aquirufa sp. TaxID=2676249 RepID=UPI0037C070F3